jgi:hypothetical protein
MESGRVSEDIRECGRRAQGDDPLLTKDMAQKLTRVFSNYEAIDGPSRRRYPGWVVAELMRALGKGAVRPIVRGFYYAARDAYGRFRWLAIRCAGFAVATIVVRPAFEHGVDGSPLKTVLAVFPEPHPKGWLPEEGCGTPVGLVEANRVHLVVLDSRDTNGRPGDALLFERCESVSVVKYRWRPRRIITKMAPFPTLAELFDPTVKRWLPSPAQVREAFAHVVEKQIDAALCFKLMSATVLDHAQSIVPSESAGESSISTMSNRSPISGPGLRKQNGFEQSIIDGLSAADSSCRGPLPRDLRRSLDLLETDRLHLLSRKPRAEIRKSPIA